MFGWLDSGEKRQQSTPDTEEKELWKKTKKLLCVKNSWQGDGLGKVDYVLPVKVKAMILNPLTEIQCNTM